MSMSSLPDTMIAEIQEQPVTHAPTMGNVQKLKYSHLDMIDYILCHPEDCTLKVLAARYGYTIGWICNVQASDAWKAAFAKRRSEVTDDVVEQTVRERMEGVTKLSLERLQEKLEAPTVSDNVVLKAVELGAKGMGLGGNAPEHRDLAVDHLAQLANRLVDLKSKVDEQPVTGRTIEQEEEA